MFLLCQQDVWHSVSPPFPSAAEAEQNFNEDEGWEFITLADQVSCHSNRNCMVDLFNKELICHKCCLVGFTLQFTSSLLPSFPPSLSPPSYILTFTSSHPPSLLLFLLLSFPSSFPPSLPPSLLPFLLLSFPSFFSPSLPPSPVLPLFFLPSLLPPSTPHQQKFGIKTTGLDDKCTAMQMLVVYAKDLKDGFADYAEPVSPVDLASVCIPSHPNTSFYIVCIPHRLIGSVANEA